MRKEKIQNEMSGFRIDDFKFEYLKDLEEIKSRVQNPTFVEGLFGVGHVGFLAANHLIEELNLDKVADVYSPHFAEPFSPKDTPGVVYTEEGVAELHKNELFWSPDDNLFVYRGLYQGDYCEFYYRHANRVIDLCEEVGVKEVFTLGGLGTGEEIEEPEARAVITSPDMKREIGQFAKVLEGKPNHPAVTGLSGLLIGLAFRNGMRGISLLGETHGAFPDPRAAKAVLETLCQIKGIDIDYEGLDEAAEEIESKRRDLKKRMKSLWRTGRKEAGDTGYIG